jgi:hypothetical protein
MLVNCSQGQYRPSHILKGCPNDAYVRSEARGFLGGKAIIDKER